MPSSHSQFLGFFCAFFMAHFLLHHPRASSPRTLINTIRRIEHVIAMLGVLGLTATTCYSRWHLSYHSSLQVATGLIVGLVVGGAYYYLTEFLPRQPLRLPAPWGSPVSSPASSPRSQASSSIDKRQQPFSVDGLRQRGKAATSHQEQKKGTGFKKTHTRRRSSLASLMPELHPAPPLRQLILDHPLAVALRLRDSWTVWLDGGIEGEYEAWRTQWERRRPTTLALERSFLATKGVGDGPNAVVEEGFEPDTPAATKKRQDIVAAGRATTSSEPHLSNIVRTLQLASQCPPTKTAFCVGCVIATRRTNEVVATGYSRETGDAANEHAEQVALNKLTPQLSSKTSSSPSANAAEYEGIVELDLYTSMEPCSERLSGASPCLDRILGFNSSASTSSNRGYKITRVFQALPEPADFVVQNTSANRLKMGGVAVATVVDEASADSKSGSEGAVGWIEREALRLAKKGHPDQPEEVGGDSKRWRDWGTQ